MCETDIIECAQLVKETVLEGGRREPSLLDHPSISRDIGTLIHNVIVAFAQVGCLLLFCLKVTRPFMSLILYFYNPS